jgi:hypothetical protein
MAAALHPVGVGILMVCGAPAIMVFALFHGAGNGLLTIAKGTLPLAIFGPVGYGLCNGILAAPARAAQAASPLIFGLLIDWLGVGALTISAGLSIAALIALMGLRARTWPTAVPSRATLVS